MEEKSQEEDCLSSPAGPGLYYPRFLRTSRNDRMRVYAWLHYDSRHARILVTDEFGEVHRFRKDDYEGFRQSALASSWCVFARLGRVAGRYPWLVDSLHDPRATLLAGSHFLERGKSLSGIEWKSGRKRAKLVNPDSWGWSELTREYAGITPLDFLHAVRRTVNSVGLGDFDTPAALGTEMLHTAWKKPDIKLLAWQGKRHRLPLAKVWRLPRELRESLHDHPVHPRIYDVKTGPDTHYDRLVEYDLRSAYATILAGTLPLGAPDYVASSRLAYDLPKWTCLVPVCGRKRGTARGVCYGHWRIAVSEGIYYGPVLAKWNGVDRSFHIQPGEYELPLWGEQAQALVDAGCTVTWQTGYLWTWTGKPFQSQIDRLQFLRSEAEHAGDPLSANMLKRLPNAAVGRFTVFQRTTISPSGASDEDGDIIFSVLDDGKLPNSESGEVDLASVHYEKDSPTAPEHWYSYIVSQISLKVWYAEELARSDGLSVISANLDSFRIVQPDLGAGFRAPEGWKSIHIRAASIKATRYIEAERSVDGGVTWEPLVKTPGKKRRVEGERR